MVFCNIFVDLALVSLIALYCYALYRFTFWKKRKVPCSAPSFPLGNCQGLSRTRNLGGIIKQAYLEGRGSPVAGFYTFFTPNLLIRDPKLIRDILTKDSAAFGGRGFKVNTNFDPLSGHLFFLEGAQWRSMRAKLTPAFTSGRMRMMHPIIQDCCQEMNVFLKSTQRKSTVIETGDLFTRYTTNVITRCAFGLDADFFKNPDPMLQKMVHRVSNPTLFDAVIRALTFTVGQFIPAMPFRLVPKELSDYFIALVRDTIEQRQKNKNNTKKDFLQLMIELINKGWLDDVDTPRDMEKPKFDYEFTPIEAAAQAFVFLQGGFDTSGTTLQFCLYELALNNDIQSKAREEIVATKERYNNQVTYECLQEMVYLDQVINETMRLHPVVPFIMRQCSRPYKVNDIDLMLEPGIKVWISASGLHSDPDLYPQPEVFDPDRFSLDKRAHIKPFTFLPFGEGPRSCIGNRFAMMNMKMGIASILSEFVVRPCEKTPAPPLKLDPKKSLALIKGGTSIRFSPL